MPAPENSAAASVSRRPRDRCNGDCGVTRLAAIVRACDRLSVLIMSKRFFDIRIAAVQAEGVDERRRSPSSTRRSDCARALHHAAFHARNILWQNRKPTFFSPAFWGVDIKIWWHARMRLLVSAPPPDFVSKIGLPCIDTCIFRRPIQHLAGARRLLSQRAGLPRSCANDICSKYGHIMNKKSALQDGRLSGHSRAVPRISRFHALRALA